jgi:hypothetical protein
VPGGLEAALVAVVLVVPGYLAIAGYGLGRASAPQPGGLAAAARAITASAVFVLVAWRVGGRSVYENARASTALAGEEGLTFRLAVAGLVIPPIVGFALGQTTDWVAGKVAHALRELDEQEETLSAAEKGRRWLLETVRARMPFDGPTTWDRVWKTLQRDEPYLYVRVVTRDGQTVVGTIGRKSRAAVSPQPRDLYIEEVLRPVRNPRGEIEFAPTKAGKGMFVAGEQIAVVEWIGHGGLKEIPRHG